MAAGVDDKPVRLVQALLDFVTDVRVDADFGFEDPDAITPLQQVLADLPDRVQIVIVVRQETPGRGFSDVARTEELVFFVQREIGQGSQFADEFLVAPERIQVLSRRKSLIAKDRASRPGVLDQQCVEVLGFDRAATLF